MKHTIIAGMLLILILLVVVMNATFVRSVTDELYTRLNELPVSKGGFEASGGDDVKSFYALWSEKRPSLSLSIHEDELDRIDDWGFARRMRDRTRVLRELVFRGLDAERADRRRSPDPADSRVIQSAG